MAGSRPLPGEQRWLAALLAAVATAAVASPEQPPALRELIEHPVHCAVLLGGDGHAADGMAPDTSEALHRALTALGGDVAAGLRAVQAGCMERWPAPAQAT